MVQGSVRILTAVAVATFAGLGGVAGAQEQPNACELFTRKEAKKILRKSVRRETDITGTEASSCSYVVERNAKRVLGFAVGEFGSKDEASKAYTAARANAKFDGLMIENIRKVGTRAYWLPETNNFERTVLNEPIAFGELTILDGRRVYTVYLAPPSKSKARDAINLVIAD
jgi:hypothetical protein